MTTSANDLRAWARGLLPLEAAVELLVTACGGALLAGPWVRQDEDGRTWFDPDVAAAEKGYLSGGERRVLAIAISLASEAHPADLSDALTGLDRDGTQAVLPQSPMRADGTSHEHGRIRDGRGHPRSSDDHRQHGRSSTASKCF